MRRVNAFRNTHLTHYFVLCCICVLMLWKREKLLTARTDVSIGVFLFASQGFWWFFFLHCIALTTGLVTHAEGNLLCRMANDFIFTIVSECKSDCLDIIKIHRDFFPLKSDPRHAVFTKGTRLCYRAVTAVVERNDLQTATQCWEWWAGIWNLSMIHWIYYDYWKHEVGQEIHNN